MSTQDSQSTPQRPIPLTVNESNIPCVLKEKTQWVNWVYQLDEEKRQYKKLPKNSFTGGNAQSNNPDTWTSFGDAFDAYSWQDSYDSVGFCFSKSDGLTGIDIDHVIDSETGEIDPRAQEILDRFKGTYCEVSPSGEGFRIFCYGKPVMPGRKNEGKIKWLELYTHPSSRYLTVTGHHFSQSMVEVTEQQDALDWLYEKYFKPAQAKPELKVINTPPVSLDDSDILDKARNASNGDRFRALFDRGDTSAYDGDESSADLALCSLLAFWTYKDAGRMDRLFRQSALMRKKWERADYRQRTLDKAIAECREVYTVGGNSKQPQILAYSGESQQSKANSNCQANENQKKGNPIKRIGDMLKEGYSYNWLVKGWIECQQSVVVFGDSQSCKTLEAIDTACCIALGIPWRGYKVKQGPVVFVVGEGAGAGIRRRFRAWEIANGKSLETAPIYIVEQPTTLPLDTERLMLDIRSTLEPHNGEMAILYMDTLSRTITGSERESKDFNAYQRALDDIRAEFKCATAILHHVGHADKGRERGASEIGSNADVRLKMETLQDGTRQLTALKIKDGETPEPMFFKLTQVELGMCDEDGKPIVSVVLQQLDGYSQSAKNSQTKLTPGERIVMRVLERMIGEAGSHDVLVEDWREAYYQYVKISDPEIKQDTLKKSWQRSINGIQKKNLVTLDGVNDTRASLPAYGVVVTTTGTPTGTQTGTDGLGAQGQAGTPGQNGTKRDNVPIIPARHHIERDGTGHTSIEVSRCPAYVPPKNNVHTVGMHPTCVMTNNSEPDSAEIPSLGDVEEWGI